MKEKENLFNLLTVSKFVEEAHLGQVDRGGHPYFGHLTRVSAKVANLLSKLPEGMLSAEDKEQAILLGLSHDLLEDTSKTKDDLRTLGANELFIKRLEALSRLDKTATYMDWIRGISAAGDVVTILVKLADNEDNNDPARIAQLPEDQRSITQRYERAHKILKAALDQKIAEFKKG